MALWLLLCPKAGACKRSFHGSQAVDALGSRSGRCRAGWLEILHERVEIHLLDNPRLVDLERLEPERELCRDAHGCVRLASCLALTEGMRPTRVSDNLRPLVHLASCTSPSTLDRHALFVSSLILFSILVLWRPSPSHHPSANPTPCSSSVAACKARAVAVAKSLFS